MLSSDTSLAELENLLVQVPLLADVHPLLPVCLSPQVKVIEHPEEMLAVIDDVADVAEYSALILGSHPVLRDRLKHVACLEHPPVDAINHNLKHRLDYIRAHLLTNHKISQQIAREVAQGQYDIVALLLVDGLSYEDVLHWKIDVTPCFIDGPSITYRLSEQTEEVIPTVGFAAILGTPTISERLYRLGYRTTVGYTYWQVGDNAVANYMFRGIANHQVVNFDSILRLLHEENILAKTYVQIVREGLDGLAHGKRELSRQEIEVAVASLWTDIERLVELLRSKSRSAVLYVVSDHGILWKTEHEWKNTNQPGSKPRYMLQQPDTDINDCIVRFELSNTPFYLFVYPYLGSSLRKNDSGTHGGLSYQESFVPFMRIEVE